MALAETDYLQPETGITPIIGLWLIMGITFTATTSWRVYRGF
jgi:hypothetical protein